MLQAAGIAEDLATGEVVTADGKTNFIEAIRAHENGALTARLLEVLCCEGCIMGAGMSTSAPHFTRRERVGRHSRARLEALDRAAWESAMREFADLDLDRRFHINDQRIFNSVRQPLDEILRRMGKESRQDELNCGACGYNTCREHAKAIVLGLAESEMCLPYTIEQLKNSIRELAVSNRQLADAQEALVQSEKMASMGQLAAGIAHEVNNPLGVVLMYAHILEDECAGDPKLSEDIRLIATQADRCKKIVAGLLHFARQNKVLTELVDLPEVIGHALETIPLPERVVIVRDFAMDDFIAEIDPNQITQVIVNLVANAVAAMPQGGTIRVGLTGETDQVTITVADTGVGIPRDLLGRIFEPFFTTKQIGQGTGLGLSIIYGIIKMHRGTIQVESNADPAAGPTGTTFTVNLPRRHAMEPEAS
jgi:signal transduction histidine kinase